MSLYPLPSMLPYPSAMTRAPARALSVLRIVVAFLYIFHGTQKLFGWPPPLTPTAPIVLFSQRGLAGILETFGGFAVLIGLFTRPVAFVLSGEMAVAYFQVHIKRGFWPILNRGENVVLFCFVFLYLFAVGGGPYSLDALRRRRRS